MSAIETPPKEKPTTPVTPGDQAGRLVEEAGSNRLESDTFDQILRLIDPPLVVSYALVEGIRTLFSTNWQMKKWSDVMVFTADDVSTAWVSGGDFPEAILTPVIAKKLGFIVECARTGVLTPDTTMGDIVSSVTYGSPMMRQKSGDLLPGSPSQRAIPAFGKIAVPTLSKFTGHDEDYFT